MLDVDGIKFVINFDYPNSSEDYIHRIGRTGRCQMTGTSYAFFTSANSRQAKDLVAVLREANQVVNPKLAEMINQGRFGGRGDRKYRHEYRMLQLLVHFLFLFCVIVWWGVNKDTDRSCVP
jgi:superfamily II DNA/RNA helicase